MGDRAAVTSSGRPTGSSGGLVKALRVRLGLSQDIQEDLGRLVQGLGALGLRGLHHEGLMDNEGEIHGGGMDAEVQQPLSHIHGGDPCVVGQPLEGHDELVHTAGVVGHVIVVHELLHQIVGVEYRPGRRLQGCPP